MRVRPRTPRADVHNEPMTERTRTTPPRRLRRLAPGHHPLGRRRRLRPHEQRPLLRADRHRGQRAPRGGDRRRHPDAAGDRRGRGGRLPLLPRDRLPRPDRPRPGRRQGRHVLGHLPDRVVPGRPRRRRCRGGRRGPVRARVRRQHRARPPGARSARSRTRSARPSYPCCRSDRLVLDWTNRG